MIALRFFPVLLFLSLLAPARAYSQGAGDAPLATPEFFSYVTGPIQRLKLANGAARFSFGGIYQEPNSEFWWMPADGQGVFVAKVMRADLALFRISIDSAEVTQIGSVPARHYTAVRGHGSTVYLLRVDTANNRYRLIADVYSIAQARIVANRTLLNLPLRPSKFPTKVMWDDRLQAVAFRLNDRPGVPPDDQADRTRLASGTGTDQHQS